jgi:hypothetical protein
MRFVRLLSACFAHRSHDEHKVTGAQKDLFEV